jgi:HlyD family secretion protein
LVLFTLAAIPFVALPYDSPDNGSAGGFLFEPAKRASILSSIEATGTVEAVSEVEVGSAVSGLVDKVFVSFNDTVTAGQPLVQLDRAAFGARASAARAAVRVASALAEVQRSGLHRAELGVAAAEAERRSAEAQAKAAQARRDEADLELQRKLRLGRSGAATEREVSEARTARDTSEAELRVALEQIELKADAIEIARADAQMALANVKNADAVVEEKQATLDEAEAELEHTVIHAPFDGIVISREVSPGQAVAAGLETKTLFRIARDLGEMQVRGSIDEADIGMVREGEEAEFSVDAYPNRIFGGRVVQVRKSPEVLQNVVTYAAIVSAPNPDKLLYPGMTASLKIITNKSSDVLTIPNSALHFKLRSSDAPPSPGELNGSIVWKEGVENHPTPVLIRTGATDGQRTEVIAGPLHEGDFIIVGVDKLRPTRAPLLASRGSNE